MAAFANLTREEKLGLAVAAVAHIALAAALMFQPKASRDYERPVRMDVSLATDVSLASTAPDPSSEPAASMAPEISDLPEPDPAPAVEQSAPEPVTQPPPRPAPAPVQTAPARPTPAPASTPAPRASQAPAQRQQAAGSRLNDNFLEGMSSTDGGQGSPASEAGPQVRASIVQSINRQLKPNWNPPSGIEVDRLVTVVRFRLNTDGTLTGNPTVIRTTGQTDTNRAQVGRHQEQAVRAVRLTAPFNLPEQYYSVWRDLEWNFDNRLAQ